VIEKAPSCPACGSPDTRIEVFGLAPLISDDTYDVRGCVVPPYAPDYGCKSCWAEWGDGVAPRCPAWRTLGDWDDYGWDAEVNYWKARRAGERIVEGADLEGRDFNDAYLR
jgi:hypothetical protein